MDKALIADIQRCSVHDGPGIRTTVFFKGCPLNCRWCHNPECISHKPQVMFYPDKCIGCGMCDQGCYSGAKVICGREYTANELMEQILADSAYYGKDGGVTFSGGEPLLQKEFLHLISDMCRKQGLHCAVETSMIIYDEDIFRGFDLIMADMKIWDDDIHKEYTGVSNVGIKENFARLNTLGIPIIARTPVIPDIDQGIDKISAFMQKLDNVSQYELLPYHPLGEGKAEALNISPVRFSVPDKDMMKELNKYAFIR